MAKSPHSYPEDISSLIQKASVSEVPQLILSFPLPLMTRCIQALQRHPHSHKKLKVIIQTLQETTHLEACGRGLSSKQFLDILKSIHHQHLAIDKLSPILVGLSPHIFFQTLCALPTTQVNILRTAGLLEPLQHHLNLFAQECELISQQYMQVVNDLYKTIHLMHREDLTQEDIHFVLGKIFDLREKYKKLLNAINKALAIAWPTYRLDLLNKLNELKEHIYHQYIQSVGLPRSEAKQPTGLFATLEQFLLNTFNSDDGEGHIIVMQDDDLAIEGLTKLSIWYLKDYWELGLLPSIQSEKDLELDASLFSEKERLKHRQEIFSLVQENLTKLGISKVKDLKKAQIFSKKMLKDYIAQHQDRLLTNS